MLRLHRELVRQVPGGEHRIAAASGRYIQRDQPDFVPAAIRDAWLAASDR